MDRRTLLKLCTATAIAGIPGASLAVSGLRVVVAGAGIVGASIAYQLAKAGAGVTVVDKLGPATHASRGTFAWINATWAKQPRDYHRLNQEGVATWRSLQDEIGIPVKWGGSLEWFDDEARQRRLEALITEQVEWGEPARMLPSQELRRLEPSLAFGDAREAVYSPNDGAVDPVLATNALLDAARGYGATVDYPCEVLGVVVDSSGLKAVDTNRGRFLADRLVLATGAADVGTRLAGIDIPQRSTPGIIVITKPQKPLLSRIIAAPGVHLHQRNDGRVVLGEQEGPPSTEAHAARLAGRPNDFPEPAIAAQHAARMLAAAAQYVPDLAGAPVDAVYIGWRPLPLDGHPVIGPSPERPDVYFAIMHSGVSLAPIVGQLAAHELIDGTEVPRLDSYRPGRTFQRVKRY